MASNFAADQTAKSVDQRRSQGHECRSGKDFEKAKQAANQKVLSTAGDSIVSTRGTLIIFFGARPQQGALTNLKNPHEYYKGTLKYYKGTLHRYFQIAKRIHEAAEDSVQVRQSFLIAEAAHVKDNATVIRGLLMKVDSTNIDEPEALVRDDWRPDKLDVYNLVIVIRCSHSAEFVAEFPVPQRITEFLVNMPKVTDVFLHACLSTEIARNLYRVRPINVFYWSSMSHINLGLIDEEHDFLSVFLQELTFSNCFQEAFERARSKFLQDVAKAPTLRGKYERKNSLLPPRTETTHTCKRIGIPEIFVKNGKESAYTAIQLLPHENLKFFRKNLLQAIFDLHDTLEDLMDESNDDILRLGPFLPTVYQFVSLIAWLCLCEFLPASRAKQGHLQPSYHVPSRTQYDRICNILKALLNLFSNDTFGQSCNDISRIFVTLSDIGAAFIFDEEYPPRVMPYSEFLATLSASQDLAEIPTRFRDAVQELKHFYARLGGSRGKLQALQKCIAQCTEEFHMDGGEEVTVLRPHYANEESPPSIPWVRVSVFTTILGLAGVLYYRFHSNTFPLLVTSRLPQLSSTSSSP